MEVLSNDLLVLAIVFRASPSSLCARLMDIWWVTSCTLQLLQSLCPFISFTPFLQQPNFRHFVFHLEVGSLYIKAKIRLLNTIGNLYYNACDYCCKGTKVEIDTKFQCLFCGHDNAVAVPRCKLEIELADKNDTIETTIFGKVAEKILSLSVQQIIEMDKKNENIDFQRIGEELDQKVFCFQLISQKHNQQGMEKIKYSMVTLHEDVTPSTPKKNRKRKLIFHESENEGTSSVDVPSTITDFLEEEARELQNEQTT